MSDHQTVVAVLTREIVLSTTNCLTANHLSIIQVLKSKYRVPNTELNLTILIYFFIVFFCLHPSQDSPVSLHIAPLTENMPKSTKLWHFTGWDIKPLALTAAPSVAVVTLTTCSSYTFACSYQFLFACRWNTLRHIYSCSSKPPLLLLILIAGGTGWTGTAGSGTAALHSRRALVLAALCSLKMLNLLMTHSHLQDGGISMCVGADWIPPVSQQIRCVCSLNLKAKKTHFFMTYLIFF